MLGKFANGVSWTVGVFSERKDPQLANWPTYATPWKFANICSPKGLRHEGFCCVLRKPANPCQADIYMTQSLYIYDHIPYTFGLSRLSISNEAIRYRTAHLIISHGNKRQFHSGRACFKWCDLMQNICNVTFHPLHFIIKDPMEHPLSLQWGNASIVPCHCRCVELSFFLNTTRHNTIKGTCCLWWPWGTGFERRTLTVFSTGMMFAPSPSPRDNKGLQGSVCEDNSRVSSWRNQAR